MTPLPRVTHLQFAVLRSLGGVPCFGATLRKRLRDEYGIKTSGPRFYQLMKRLESDGLIKLATGTDLSAHPLTTYILTRAGEKAVSEVQAFYKDRT